MNNLIDCLDNEIVMRYTNTLNLSMLLLDLATQTEDYMVSAHMAGDGMLNISIVKMLIILIII